MSLHSTRRAGDIDPAWLGKVDAARIAWSDLTEAELLNSRGREETLAGLVAGRYLIPRLEAYQQVLQFLGRHRS